MAHITIPVQLAKLAVVLLAHKHDNEKHAICPACDVISELQAKIKEHDGV